MTLPASEVNELRSEEVAKGLHPIFRQRWSPRSFLKQEVSLADLRHVFDAARWAASSGNGQPLRFIVGVRKSATHKRIVSTRARFNKEWAPNAPVLILGTANTLNAEVC